MDFDYTTVRHIVETTGVMQAEVYLSLGWTLLLVSNCMDEDEDIRPCYVLGWCHGPEAKYPSD